jgi:hypothetical protein
MLGRGRGRGGDILVEMMMMVGGGFFLRGFWVSFSFGMGELKGYEIRWDM